MASMPRVKELQALVDLQKSPSTHLKANLCSKQLKYIPGHVGVLRNLDTLLLRNNCLDALPEEIADLPIVSIRSIVEGKMNQSLLELHTFWCFSGRSSMNLQTVTELISTVSIAGAAETSPHRVPYAHDFDQSWSLLLAPKVYITLSSGHPPPPPIQDNPPPIQPPPLFRTDAPDRPPGCSEYWESCDCISCEYLPNRVRTSCVLGLCGAGSFGTSDISRFPARTVCLWFACQLKVLDVGHNQFEEIPPCLANCPRLTTLRINDNVLRCLDSGILGRCLTGM